MSVNEKITNIADTNCYGIRYEKQGTYNGIGESHGLDLKEVSDMLSALSSVVSSKLVDNDTIYLQGFGQFEVKKKAERISVNPANGKRYLVPPKLVPVFKPERP